jgi:hypothetical protein
MSCFPASPQASSPSSRPRQVSRLRRLSEELRIRPQVDRSLLMASGGHPALDGTGTKVGTVMNTICRSPVNIVRRWYRSSAGAASRPTSRTPGSGSGGAAPASVERQRHSFTVSTERREQLHGWAPTREAAVTLSEPTNTLTEILQASTLLALFRRQITTRWRTARPWNPGFPAAKTGEAERARPSAPNVTFLLQIARVPRCRIGRAKEDQ